MWPPTTGTAPVTWCATCWRWAAAGSAWSPVRWTPRAASTGSPATRRCSRRRASSDERLIVSGDYSRASGEAGAERLLAQAPDIDAVFVASDLMAQGALTALRRAGRRVPEDVAVGGFDDSVGGDRATPALTTIRQP